ncbi:MAG: hypothetical protein ACM3QX_09375 [Syntrophomonadaceae bacterium]
MKTFGILPLLAIVIMAAAGCEKTETLEPDSIYKEKTVVFASLKKDSLFQGVTFTRTLPLNDPYDIKKAELKDVTAYLKINGLEVIPVLYSKDGIYKPLTNLYIHTGTVYELYANWEGKSIYAITRVPEEPTVTRATLVNSQYIEARIIPRINESYAAAWFISGVNQYTFSGLATDFFEVYESPEQLPSNATIRTMDIPEEYRTDFHINRTLLKVFSFDKGFYDYFRTRGNNLQVHNSFTQGGSQIIWNVYGNDVIGLFIGSAAGDFVKPN